LAWLGGMPRYMASDGKVGFHVAFVDQNGTKLVSGQANAILGAYLTRIGLPVSAVLYVTQAAPDAVTWLTPESAKQYGIDVLSDLPHMPQSAVKPEHPPSAPTAKRSYWSHNGSVVYLQADGSSRKFFYHQPRDGMLHAGATPGSLLFEGERTAPSIPEQPTSSQVPAESLPIRLAATYPTMISAWLCEALHPVLNDHRVRLRAV
jgi:hypothetical protein